MSPFDRKTSLSLEGVSVMIGIPVGGGMLPVDTVNSLVQTCLSLKAHGVPFELLLLGGCSIVQHARCYVGHGFLESTMNRLFMIDADIAWKPEDFMRMLALSTRMDVVCAAYPAKRDAVTFMLTDMDTERMKTNEYGCLPIHGVGLGFTVITREVMQRQAEAVPKVIFSEHPELRPYLFRCDIHNGSARGEDIAFFADLMGLGYTVWLDPAVSLGHIGTKVYRGSIRDALQKVA